MMGSSDILDPAGHVWETGAVNERPLTVVFAGDRSSEAIKEALFARRDRTAAIAHQAGEPPGNGRMKQEPGALHFSTR